MLNQKKKKFDKWMDYTSVKPFALVHFMTPDNRIAYTGLLVDRSTCPFLHKIQSHVLYVMFSSQSDNGNTNYIHVQRLVYLQSIAQAGGINGVVKLDIEVLAHNPWLQGANKTKQEVVDQRKKIVEKLQQMLWDYTMNPNGEWDCDCQFHIVCCCKLKYRDQIQWHSMLYGGKSGLMSAGARKLATPDWGIHMYDCGFVNVAKQRLGLR